MVVPGGAVTPIPVRANGMTRPVRNWPQIGCAMLLTAAVAFPAGVWLAGRSQRQPVVASPTNAARSSSPAAEVRDVYSANVRNDPYVLDRQRAVVESMERLCRIERRDCAEAVQARRYLDARTTDD